MRFWRLNNLFEPELKLGHLVGDPSHIVYKPPPVGTSAPVNDNCGAGKDDLR